MKNNLFRYAGVLLKGRQRVGIDDTYVNIHRRMFAVLIDVFLMMLLLKPLLDIILEQLYPGILQSMQQFQQVIIHVGESQAAKDSMNSYLQDPLFQKGLVTSYLLQIISFCLVTMGFWVKFGATPG